MIIRFLWCKKIDLMFSNKTNIVLIDSLDNALLIGTDTIAIEA